jgi:hypothetical protein
LLTYKNIFFAVFEVLAVYFFWIALYNPMRSSTSQ